MNDKLQRRGKLPIPFVGLCDGHIMSKVTQYATKDAKYVKVFQKSIEVCSSIIAKTNINFLVQKLGKRR